MSAVIRLNGIVKKYGQYRALDSVTCEIGSGITGLLGPNGAGKSTLIKVLMGLVRVTSGTGEVLGMTLGKNQRGIRARIGYMPEDDCYIPGLTGIEMVQFAARLSGYEEIEAIRRAHEILDFCGAEQERYRAVDGYSTGMRQKLKFAQAIVHDPDLLILDEPTAGLDPEERTQFLSRVRVLSERSGKAVLICTHILPDVQEICESVVILARGKVRLQQSLSILQQPSTPTYHVRFGSDPTLFLERVRRGGLKAEPEENGNWSLHGFDAGNVDQIWDWARESDVPIRALIPARNTLEAMFMDAIRESGNQPARAAR